MKLVLATLVGSFACLLTGTAIAIAMQSYIAPQLVPHIRTETEGLLFPSLFAGYFVIGAMLVAVGSLAEVADRSWLWVFKMGTTLGLAVFLGDHLITAGWSRLAAIPMAISGIFDALSIVVGFASVSFVLKRGSMRDGNAVQ